MGNTENFGDNPRRVGLAERWWAPYKLKLSENYNFVSKNVFIKFLYYIILFGGLTVVNLVCYIRWDFRISGKENVKLIKDTSAITVSNHVHDMDSPMLTRAFYPDTPYFVALKHNFEMFAVGIFVRLLRGVPLPSTDDLKVFGKALKKGRKYIGHSGAGMKFSLLAQAGIKVQQIKPEVSIFVAEDIGDPRSLDVLPISIEAKEEDTG